MDSKSLFVCPSCRRALYDRRRKKCGYCGAAIPEAMRHSQAMIDDLEKGKFSEKRGLEIQGGGSGSPDVGSIFDV